MTIRDSLANTPVFVCLPNYDVDAIFYSMRSRFCAYFELEVSILTVFARTAGPHTKDSWQ